MGLDALRHGLVERGLFREKLQPDQAPPAHHRQGLQLALQQAAVGLQVGIGQQGDIERIVNIRDDALGQVGGPLQNLTTVLAVDQHARHPGRRLFEEGVDLGPFGQFQRV